MSDLIQDLTEDSFQSDVLNADGPILVDFWAEWCGPCRALTPVLEETAKSYEGKIAIKKLNVDEARSTAMKYNVQSIPMMIVFQGGEVKESVVGLVSKSKLSDMLEKYVA